MAIIRYGSDDANAPQVSSSEYLRYWTVELLIQCLVNGYTGKPGQGWTLTHDSRASDGKTVLQDPEGTFYVFEIEPANNDDLYVGMAQNSDAAGNLTHYKSGTYCSLDSLGNKQFLSSNYWQCLQEWVLLYDDVSHSLHLQGGNTTYLNTSYSLCLDELDYYSFGMYLGRLNDSGSYAPKCVFLGDLVGYYYNPHLLFGADGITGGTTSVGYKIGTCLYADDGVLSQSGEALKARIQLQAGQGRTFDPITHPTPTRIGGMPVAVYKYTESDPRLVEMVGTWKGVRQISVNYYAGYNSRRDEISAWLDPVTTSANENHLMYPCNFPAYV